MDIKTALSRIVGHLDLSTAEMSDVMREIMTGQCTDAQIGAFMMAMRMKSESIDEIVGAVSVMRELADKVELKTLGGGLHRGQARQPSGFRQKRQRGSARSGRDLPEPDTRPSGALHRQRGHRLHVCPVPPRRDETRSRPAQGSWPAYPVQYARPAYESGRCEASGGGRVQPGPVPTVGRSVAAHGQQACAGGAFERRPGRIQPGGTDLCGGAEE